MALNIEKLAKKLSVYTEKSGITENDLIGILSQEKNQNLLIQGYDHFQENLYKRLTLPSRGLDHKSPLEYIINKETQKITNILTHMSFGDTGGI